LGQQVFSFYNQVVEQLPPYAGILIRLGTIVLITFVIITVGGKLIEKVFSINKSERFSLNESKKKTLVGLLKSIVRYITYFVAGVNILELFGINTTSLLTAAGIGGLAIGFGAQSLVKDVITGFFIIFEDQYSAGDYVQIGDISGVVEEIGLRVSKLRDFSGQLHIIPNGEIKVVTNNSRGPMRALVSVRMTYEADIERAIKVLNEVCSEIKQKRDDIIEGPSVLGITNLGPSEVDITIIAKTIPMQQWSVERDLRKVIKERFYRDGIDIPYPRTVIISKTKEGCGFDELYDR
jgi:small-conductance mechanosensitive channel